MRQRTFFDDDVPSKHIVATPAEAAAIREHELEQALASLATPEERQRYFARLAEEERRAARESRQPC